MRIHHWLPACAVLAAFAIGSPLSVRAQDRKAAEYAPPTHGAGSDDPIERVQSSMTVLSELTTGPDETIPSNLLSSAEAIIVIPSLVKGGFILGAKHGTGVASVRHTSGGMMMPAWSPPAFVKITGGSIGWQIGVESVDLVLLVMNRSGIDDLLADRFTVGANLSLAAGPVGRSGDAATDAKLGAGILAYSRAKGLFAGATLEGAGLHAAQDQNESVYGRGASLKGILLEPQKKDVMLPPAIRAWQDLLARVAMRKAS